MSYHGIDYGLGRTNLDGATGIRYGVISQHSLADWFYDEFEPDYGAATCPVCGNECVDASAIDEDGADGADFEDDRHGAAYLHADADEWDNYSSHGCNDYACRTCRHYLDSADAFGDEPIGFNLDTDGIRAESCLDSDVIVTASPFYTFGPFCSPCVPGAVNLDSAYAEEESGPKAYCFGHEWFEDGRAPYRVFRVADNTEVFPEEK